MIFMAPRSVVAELCPLGYCTQSFERLSGRLGPGPHTVHSHTVHLPLARCTADPVHHVWHRLGLTYMRWTNSIKENARAEYDTVVDPPQFVALMRKAVRAGPWSTAPGAAPAPPTTHHHQPGAP